MEIYILPDKVQPFMKKVERMVSHLEQKPTITVSEPFRQKIIQIVEINRGWDGRSRNSYYLDLVKIEIEDVCQDGWTIVASIFHKDGIVEMVDSSYFKYMPKHYGLNYVKCDYCGRVENRRSNSFVIHNPGTGEWKQVGSSCIDKMFNNGKYLANFAIQLYELVSINFGCCGLDPIMCGKWSAPDNYYKQAVSIEDMVHCVKDWREAGNTRWEKPKYGPRGKEAEGSTFYLTSFYDEWISQEQTVDKSFFTSVEDYVKGLDSEESGFNHNIKKAFEAGFIAKHEVYIPFFAVKMYLESLQEPFVERAAKNGIVEGEKYHIVGRIIGVELEEGFYGDFWSIGIKDENTGYLFIKESTSRNIFDKYTDDQGIVRFTSTIGHINQRKELIKLSGRVSK